MNLIVHEFIKDLKMENHQSIAFVHNDKDHKHIHLYINRIDFNGNAYKDNFIGKRSHKAAERVALKLGLETVKQVREKRLEKLKDIRTFIKEKHDHCLNTKKPKDYLEYIIEMKQYNIEVIPVINKVDKLQGFRYLFKGVNLKGSEVHRSLSINKIGFTKNKKNKNLKI